MPEYLAPGVFIEETSFRGKSIEGVSTSTAGFVGRAARGVEGRPQLVTSYTQFVRDYGPAIPSPSGPGDYLGHAVRGFFDNGGLRAYVVRVLGDGAAAATTEHAGSTSGHGVVLRLAKNTTVLPGATMVSLDSLRGVSKAAAVDLQFYARASASDAFTLRHHSTVSAYDPVGGTVTLTTPFPAAGSPISSANAYVRIAGVAPEGGITATKAPRFVARDRGEAGNDLSVRITLTDRPPVRIANAVTAGDTTVDLATVAGFYTGALAEIDDGVGAKAFATVTAVDPDLKRITVAGPLGAVALTTPAAQYVRVLELAIEVLDAGSVVESFVGLSGNPDTAPASYGRYFAARLDDPDTGSAWISVVAGTGTSNVPTDWPVAVDGQPIALALGDDGSAPEDRHLVGEDGGPGARTGIRALTDIEGISIVAVPGVTTEAVQSALIAHCELMRYRVAVLDAPSDKVAVGDLSAHRNAYDSTRAAYYAPWLETMDLSTGRSMIVPPSGHVMGIYARTDNERGVHKAPANAVVRGITGVTVPYTTGEQEVVNPLGVNLIREFDGRGILVWGARTASSDQEWKYLNVRRLFVFCEASIDRGTKWVVFEPNNQNLWEKVVSSITSFLVGVWKTGALMGTTPDQAFFVRCDRTTMTQDDIDNGRLVCLIGLAPTKPAEFVIFRIGQFVPPS